MKQNLGKKAFWNQNMGKQEKQAPKNKLVDNKSLAKFAQP